MRILALNSGSSSIKCALYQFPEVTSPIWKKKIEWKNVQEVSFEEKLLPLLEDKEIDCIGHRIVHGGTKYRKSVVIDEEVKQEISRLASLAPLHNSVDLAGIAFFEKHFPKLPQIAVFDTAFHHTLPPFAYIYPGPFEWIKMGIQKFGFHGINFQYCTKKAFEMLKSKTEKMVICHLGSGASLCAVQDGKSIDTTMGFTPLEGLMMDTRSGTVDPGILLYLLQRKKVEELTHELYEKSGLLGLSGISSDMRDILEAVGKGDERAQLSIEVYLHRLVSMIGSMVASLGGLDVLVFTAGIGENAPFIRKQVCDRLAFLGIELDEPKIEGDRILSSTLSKVKVLLIQSQEALEIARECWITLYGNG